MCWISSKQPEIRTADKDIVVYKVVKAAPKQVDSAIKVATSYYYIFRYQLGVTYKQKFRIGYMAANKLHIIEEGIHSYSYDITRYWIRMRRSIVIYGRFGRNIAHYKEENLALMECIIPKGATYAMNELGEIVSDKIQPIRITTVQELVDHSQHLP